MAQFIIENDFAKLKQLRGEKKEVKGKFEYCTHHLTTYTDTGIMKSQNTTVSS